MARKTIDIDTSDYTRSHGTNPKGRGGWAFSTYPNPQLDDVFFTPSMTYSDAKVWAKAHARANYPTADTLYVQP